MLFWWLYIFNKIVERSYLVFIALFCHDDVDIVVETKDFLGISPRIRIGLTKTRSFSLNWGYFFLAMICRLGARPKKDIDGFFLDGAMNGVVSLKTNFLKNFGGGVVFNIFFTNQFPSYFRKFPNIEVFEEVIF
jgi:hypothetical protein